METISEFIKNKAYFGGYPTQQQVEEYQKFGFRYFVNLTNDGEKRLTPYKTEYEYIQYPISDHRIPSDWQSFATLIIKLSNIIRKLSNGKKMYIHCKGGHGRAGVVVACILCYLYKISPVESISKTTKYHNRRKGIRDKWKKMGSPQTRSQKHFVTKFFEPLIVYNNINNNYFSSIFGNEFPTDIKIPNLGEFKNAQLAYKAFKQKVITECENDNITKNIWGTIKEDAMYTILSYKFDQHNDISNKLLNTGLRPVIIHSNNVFWGYKEKTGRNILGKMITKLREELYLE